MKRLIGVVLLALLSGTFIFAGASPATATNTAAGRLVSDDPANWTPHATNGRVNSVVQVGDTIVMGGTFTTVRNNSSQTTFTRNRLLAFNATTGVISTTFLPEPNGEVNVVLPAADGTSVYVGGSFTSIGGGAAKYLARVRISDGSLITSFNGGSPTGQVNDLRRTGNRLWVAGAFTHITNRAQKGLATLNATTGAYDSFFNKVIAGTQNGGTTGVAKIDVSPDGSRLVAIGNFATVDAQSRRQLFVLDTDGSSAQVDSWQTPFYEASCASVFNSYMRDLDISPDGTFFVVTTTGAYGGSNAPCDTASRFELTESGTGRTPSWVNYTGGDTTYAVEITDSVVYTGGHARWQNNPFAGDTAGPGAVSRPGIAALSPDSGLPFSWNPTRTRGVGVFDMLSTSQGLWIASDTERVGQGYEYHGRIAMFPAAGQQFPAVKVPSVPNDIYLAGTSGANSDPSVLHRVNAAGNELVAAKGIDWTADTNESPSPYLTTNVNRAGYGTVGSVDSTVPAGTPVEVFSNEAWDAGGDTEMNWSFPVTAGLPLQVRLYFANRYDGTSQPGQRVFDVSIDDSVVLNNFDIAAAAGHNTGTMRQFEVSSDGSVDINFGHEVENPLINGIEIVRTDLPATATGAIVKRSFDGSTAGPNIAVPDGGIDWQTVRGAFMINGYLYLASSDGSFSRRTFNGSSYGAVQAVNAQDELNVLQEWKTDAAAATSMWYDFGRIYFTKAGTNAVYYRYFNPESGVVGAKRLVAAENLSNVNPGGFRSAVIADGKLYYAVASGNLYAMDWDDSDPEAGVPSGTPALVSGPANDGPSWGAKALFLYQNSSGNPAPQPPVATFDTDCDELACAFDASGSSAPGSTISSYQWNFGDGDSGTGVSPDHSFDAAGTYTVELTVNSAAGGTSTTSREVIVAKVNKAPTAAFTADCTQLACEFDGSGSTDPDGPIASWTWDIDGVAKTGETTDVTFDSPGDKEVTLTVKDAEGLEDSVTKTVTVAETPAATVDYVAANSNNGNRSTHSVTIPNSVQAGDRLVLFLTTNSNTSTINGPSGWTSIRAVESSGFRSQAWTKVATASDAGATVAPTTSALAKASVSVAAYRGSAGTPTVFSEGARSVSASSAVTSPTVDSDVQGAWLISYWGVKVSTPVSLNVPGGSDQRVESIGSGSGQIDAWLYDSGAAVTGTEAGGLEATTSAAASRAAIFSIVLGAS